MSVLKRRKNEGLGWRRLYNDILIDGRLQTSMTLEPATIILAVWGVVSGEGNQEKTNRGLTWVSVLPFAVKFARLSTN